MHCGHASHTHRLRYRGVGTPASTPRTAPILRPRHACVVQERSIEKDVATLVKKTLDENLGGTWHVVVGESFGCSVTHETKYIAFFQLGLVYFLVFRSLDDEPIPED